jgi:hypothetical protein
VTTETQTVEAKRDFLVVCFEKARSEIAHRCCCRHCGEQSSLLDEVCRVCGTQDPVRLPVRWLAFSFAILVALSLIVIM